MKNDLIFIPVLKNKAVAEPKAIQICTDLFSSNIIPYIEIINENEESRGYLNTQKSIKNIVHFEQIYRKNGYSLLDIISKTKKRINREDIIFSIDVKSQELIDNFSDIDDYIGYVHKSKKNCAIRTEMISNLDVIQKLLNILNNKDYLIFDIKDNDYQSLNLFFLRICQIKHACKIVTFSDERPNNSTNKSLAINDYNHFFNTSVVESIKNDTFTLDGFGSYCSAKNDLNQGGSYMYKVYGAFVIYNFEKNDFFSFKTENTDFLPNAYKSIKDILKDNYDLVMELFSETEKSHAMICEFLDNNEKKGTAATYISFSIVHYIEEIINGLFS